MTSRGRSPDSMTYRSLAIRAAGWLLVLVAIPFGVGSAVVALLGVAAVTENPFAGALAQAVALVVVTGGTTRLGARLASHEARQRRWLPRIITAATLALVGTATAVLLFAPAPTHTPFRPTGDWQFAELSSGSRIAYRRTPSGSTTQATQTTPVILVHGGPGAPEGGLESVVPALTDAGFDVYTYHQVGAGLSERLEDVAEYTADRHVADLEALRAVIGSDQVILIGESWGGTLIANYLAVHAEHAAKAVVSSPGTIWAPAFAEINGLTASGRRDQNEVIMRYPRFLLAHAMLGTVGSSVAHTLLPNEQMDGVFEEVVGNLDLWSGCPAAQQPTGEAVHDRQAGVGFWVNAVTGRDMHRVVDPRPVLRRVATPLLVLRSECDYVAWEATREYRDLLPNAVMLTIDDAGHVIPDAQGDLYREAVRAFLQSTPLPLQPYMDHDVPW